MKVNGVDKNPLSAYTNAVYTKPAQAAAPEPAHTTEPPDNALTKADQEPAVVVSLSPEAMKEAETANVADETEKTLAEQMEDIRSESESLRRQLESARRQGDAIAKTFETKRKCLIIAMRIMRGDKVPHADYRYLAKNEPKMYEKAIMLRVRKAKPVKHKRLSKEEKNTEKLSGAPEKPSGTDESASENAKASEPPVSAAASDVRESAITTLMPD